MAIYSRFTQYIQRQLIRLAVGIPAHTEGKRIDIAAPGIYDGADYSLPILLPEDVKRAYLQQPNGLGKLQKHLQESARDTFRFQFDTPMRNPSDLPFIPPTEDPLKEWDWSTRKYVLSSCHSVYDRNALANTAIQYTADFVIGAGFNLTFSSKHVKEILTAFIENSDNAIREYERQATIDLQVDGELFLRLFEQDGAVVSVPLRPWECHYIQTELGFFRRPEIYKFQIYKTEGDAWAGESETELEDIPAQDILHVAINRRSYELRGRPELYRILAWLRADKEFLENRARQNHWRNALLWLVKVKGMPAQVAAVASRWSKPPTPGSVAIESDNVDVSPLSNGVGASDAMEDGRQIKLRNIMGLRLPEFFFADGYNANLATATAQTLPAMTKFSAFQTVLVEQLWYPLFKRVIECAVQSGLCPEMVDEEDSEGELMYVNDLGHYIDDDEEGAQISRIKACDAFEVSYAPLGTRDDLSLAQALALMATQGWVDDTTAQERLGLDPVMVNKRLKRQENKRNEDMATGNIPTPPGMMPPDMGDDDTDEMPAEDESEESEDEYAKS